MPLVSPRAVFVQDKLRPETVLGKLSAYTWPAQPGAPVIDLGPTPVGDFIPQGEPIPVLAMPIATAIAEVSKIAFVVPFDRRVFETASRLAIEQALAVSIAASEDYRLLDDAPAAIGERPAGLRHAAPVFTAAGTSAAEIADALAAAMASVRGGAASYLVAIATASTAGYLGSLGTFPNARADGTGYLGGLPLFIARAGPPVVVLADARALAVVDGGVEMTTARDAAIDFTSPPLAQPASLVSLWQVNAIGVKTVRYVWWWRPADATAVLDLGLAGS